MDDQNINTIVAYLNENPDQSTQTLVQNLINAGYPIEDIKSALSQLGISPLVIPGYKEVTKTSNITPSSFLPGRTFIAAIGAAVILLCIYYMGDTNIARMLQNIPFLGRTPQLSRPAETTMTPTPTVPTPPAVKIANNPFILTLQSLENGSYKITTNTTSANQSFALAETYYVHNGFVAKIESEATTFFITDQAVYMLDHVLKEYTMILSTDLQYEPMISSYQQSFIITYMSALSLHWEHISKTQWKATDTDVESDYVISLNPGTQLIESVTITDANIGTITTTFAYEPVTINEELFTIPDNYKKVELEKN